jgi:hypothetical protein
MPERSELAAFDLTEGRIVATAGTAENDLLVEANRSYAVTLSKGTRTLRRYTLPGLKLTRKAVIPMKSTPVGMAMGPGGHDHMASLFIAGAGPGGLSETLVAHTGSMTRMDGRAFDEQGTFEVGPDARVFATYFGRHHACQAAPGRKVVFLEQLGNRVKRTAEGQPELTGMGTCSGLSLVGTTEGAYEAFMTRQLGMPGVCIPVCGHHDMMARVAFEGGRAVVRVTDKAGADVMEFEGVEGVPMPAAGGKPSDIGRRMLVSPEARAMIVIPSGEDRLIVLPARR